MRPTPVNANLIAAAIAALFAANASAADAPAGSTVIALHCPRLIDTEAGKLLGETTIVIDGKRIKEVKAGHADVAGAQNVELKDQTCMPGLIDSLRKCGVLPNIQYDVIIDSSEVKTIKPEAKLYKVATEKAHFPAGDILLIDDSRVNLMAAEKHGWHVLWFDDSRPDEGIARIKSALEEVRARFGPVNGIIHAAGVMDDEPIESKSLGSMRRVLYPKVAGAIHLENDVIRMNVHAAAGTLSRDVPDFGAAVTVVHLASEDAGNDLSLR